MKGYKPSSEISKYYSILFSLPSTLSLAILTILLNILIYIMLHGESLIYIIYFIATITIVSTYAYLCDSVFRRFKRVLGLSLIVESIAFITGLINPVLGIVYSSVFLILAILGIDGTKLYRYLVAILPPLIILILYGYMRYILLLLIPVLIDYSIYLIMGIYRINRYKLPDLGTMYLRNYLMRSREIEEFFDHIASSEVAYPRIIMGGGTIFIYTDIHYGPFSNIGSSMLPSILVEKLKRIGYNNIVVFHGMGSHDRNLPTYRHTLEYIEELIRDVESGGWGPLKYYGWKRLRGGDGWDLLIMAFDKIALILISREKGIDDLPYSLQVEIERKAMEKGLGDIVLIDCHNHELSDEPDLESLKGLLGEALDLIAEIRSGEPIEYHVYAVSTHTNAPGIINGYISISKLETRKNSIILVYLPGNNMEPGLRTRIKEIISRETGHPPDNIEVLTNDEHTETGISAKAAYIPVLGSTELFNSIRELIHRLEDSKPVKQLYYKKSYHDVKIINEKIIVLKNMIRKGFILSASLILSYVFLTPIILYLLIV